MRSQVSRARRRDCLFVDDVEVNCEVARELYVTAVGCREPGQAVAEIRAALAEETSGCLDARGWGLIGPCFTATLPG